MVSDLDREMVGLPSSELSGEPDSSNTVDNEIDGNFGRSGRGFMPQWEVRCLLADGTKARTACAAARRITVPAFIMDFAFSLWYTQHYYDTY
jgi:hypothetical protein